MPPDPLTTVDPALSPIDDALGYEIGVSVNLPQLQAELSTLTGTAILNMALSFGPDNAQTLWVCPAGVDPALVAQAVADHRPNPVWGIPQSILDFQAALARLRADPETTLTEADRDALLRGVCLNFSAIVNPGGE